MNNEIQEQDITTQKVLNNQTTFFWGFATGFGSGLIVGIIIMKLVVPMFY